MNQYESMLEIVSRIKEVNENNDKDPIPSSENIFRKLCSDLAMNSDQLMYFIKLLNESHHLFTVKIVEADERLMIAGIDGFIVAELPILAKLKEKFFRDLETTYSAQKYERKQAPIIMREMVGEARQFNNTPLGNALNVCIMLAQFEHVMTNTFAEFSNTWKNDKLKEILGTEGPDDEESDSSGGEDIMGGATPTSGGEPGYEGGGDSGRAVDSQEYEKLQEMDLSGKWGETVKKYGVEFLVRIHFRKYEFAQVKSLVRSNRIAREVDLKYIRDTLRKMENNTDNDPKLKVFMREMQDLRRMVQARLNRLFHAKKEG